MPKRDFKGIWISAEIWLSRELSLMEKVLFVEIHSLDNERGCFASNGYFAEFFGVSDRQIRKVIQALQKKKFIQISIRNRNERTIRTIGKYRRIAVEDLKVLNLDRLALLNKLRVPGTGKGGRNKSSYLVGTKVPGR